MSKCISTTDCQGNTLCTNVPIDSTVRAIQAPEDVMKVCLVNNTEFDKTIKCEIDGTGTPTGVQVIIVTSYNDGVPSNSYYNLATGAVWAGDPATDLSECSGTSLESEVREMCDSGTTFLRWYAIQDGSPTGTSIDTDLDGAPYTVTGTVSLGACNAVLEELNTPGIKSFLGVIPASGLPATVKSITITVLADTVTVNDGTNGDVVLPQDSSFSWGEGDENSLDISSFTFTGDLATSEYLLHWEA